MTESAAAGLQPQPAASPEALAPTKIQVNDLHFYYHGFHALNAAHAVHMARDDVAAQAVVGAQGFFEVDGSGFAQTCGLVQRFRRDVDGETPFGRGQRGDRHAGAVEGDAVAQADIVQVAGGRGEGEPLAVLRGRAEVVDGGDAPDAGDDAGEHPGIFAGSPRRASCARAKA